MSLVPIPPFRETAGCFRPLPSFPARVWRAEHLIDGLALVLSGKGISEMEIQDALLARSDLMSVCRSIRAAVSVQLFDSHRSRLELSRSGLRVVGFDRQPVDIDIVRK